MNKALDLHVLRNMLPGSPGSPPGKALWQITTRFAPSSYQKRIGHIVGVVCLGTDMPISISGHTLSGNGKHARVRNNQRIRPDLPSAPENRPRTPSKSSVMRQNVRRHVNLYPMCMGKARCPLPFLPWKNSSPWPGGRTPLLRYKPHQRQKPPQSSTLPDCWPESEVPVFFVYSYLLLSSYSPSLRLPGECTACCPVFSSCFSSYRYSRIRL